MGLLDRGPGKSDGNSTAVSEVAMHEKTSYTILLTGSTGNFGAYLVDTLLAQLNIVKIICLNHSANASERQQVAHVQRGLVNLSSEQRVQFMNATFDEERLGLSAMDYSILLDTVDLVVHNGWPVDFNRNFSSFKPSIDGVQHLIDLCLARSRRNHQSSSARERPSIPDRQEPPIKLLFISSIGATSNWGSAAPSARAEIPEVELTDWKVARTGYGQSKLVSERLLAHASRTFYLPVSIVRVGQLAGPVLHGEHGRWPEQEWLPSLIRSSLALRVLPENLGPAEVVDWVPADIAARVVVELCTDLLRRPFAQGSMKRETKKAQEARFFHMVNPRATHWKDLVPVIRRYMPSDVNPITFVQWVDHLKQSAQETDGFQGVDGDANPAVELIDFFDNLQDRAIRLPKTRTSPLETKKTVKVSGTLAQLQEVGPEWVELWMRQWNL